MSIDFYYYPGSPPCRTVLGVGAALGIKFELKLVDLFTQEHLKPDFVKINPRHTIPTIIDNGFVLVESRAICQYLANAYGKNDTLYPKAAKQRALVDQILFFDMGSLNKSFGIAYIPTLFGKGPVDPEKVKDVDTNLEFFEEMLSKSKYSAGDNLTIADYSVITTLSTLEACNHKFTKYPLIVAYMNRCKSEMKGYSEWNEAAVKGIRDMWKKVSQ